MGTNETELSELLSAYLDGELTADEQGQVEQQLAESADARALLDELRAVRTSLAALPQQRLGESLAARVLAQAELKMLAGDSEQRVEHQAQPPVAIKLPPSRSTTSSSVLEKLWRPALWAAAATAAGLLLMLAKPQPQREIAQLTPGTAEVALDNKKSVTPHYKAALPPEQAAKSLARKATSIDAPASAPPTPREPAAVVPQSGSIAGGAVTQYDYYFQQSAPSAPPSTAGDSVTLGTSSTLQIQQAKEAPPTTLAGKGGKAPADPPALNTDPVAGNELSKLVAPDNKPAEGVLVVQCDISPEAARGRAFDKLLAEQHIVLGDVPVDESYKRADEGKDLFGFVQPEVSASANSQPAPPPGEVDVVLVEASPAQIEATLSSLANSPDQCLSLAVDPQQDSHVQRGWVSFNRAYQPQPVESAKADNGRRGQSRDRAAARFEDRANLSRSGGQNFGGAWAKRVQVPAPAAPADPALAFERRAGKQSLNFSDGGERQRDSLTRKSGEQFGDDQKVRALFLLRVVDPPPTAGAIAAPAAQR